MVRSTLKRLSGGLATGLARRLELYSSTVDGPKTGRELKRKYDHPAFP